MRQRRHRSAPDADMAAAASLPTGTPDEGTVRRSCNLRVRRSMQEGFGVMIDSFLYLARHPPLRPFTLFGFRRGIRLCARSRTLPALTRKACPATEGRAVLRFDFVIYFNGMFPSSARKVSDFPLKARLIYQGTILPPWQGKYLRPANVPARERTWSRRRHGKQTNKSIPAFKPSSTMDPGSRPRPG